MREKTRERDRERERERGRDRDVASSKKETGRKRPKEIVTLLADNAKYFLSNAYPCYVAQMLTIIFCDILTTKQRSRNETQTNTSQGMAGQANTKQTLLEQ